MSRRRWLPGAVASLDGRPVRVLATRRDEVRVVDLDPPREIRWVDPARLEVWPGESWPLPVKP